MKQENSHGGPRANSGGPRPGAGRPPKAAPTTTIRIAVPSPDQLAQINQLTPAERLARLTKTEQS